jgi:hypothetical protein
MRWLFLAPLVLLLVALHIARHALLRGRAAVPRAGPDGTVTMAFPGRSRLYIVLPSTLCLAFILVLPLIVGFSHPLDVLPFALLLAFFAVGAAGSLREALTTVSFSPAGITSRSPLRKPRFMRWEVVRGISYRRSLEWLTLTADNAPTIRVSALLPGIDGFVHEVWQRVEPSACGGVGEYSAQRPNL